MKTNSPSKKNYLANKAFQKAEKLQAKGLYIQAAKLHLHASKLFSSPQNIAGSLYNVGKCYQNNNDLINAEKYYQQALTLQKKILSKDHPDIVSTLNNLGVIYKDTNQCDKAEDYYQQALDIRQKIYPKDHPDIAKSLNNLGALYHTNNQLEKAEASYQQAKNISEKHSNFTDQIIDVNLSKLKQKLTRLETENLEMKAALHQSDRLAYLGRMATMMAHNIKNPVNNITTATVSLKMGIKSQKITPEKQLESLDRILSNSERLNQTIEHFRDFSQADSNECITLDLNQTLDDVYQLLFAGQYQFHGISIIKNYCSPKPMADSNCFSLQEILTTLLNNAKEATHENTLKKVTISTWKKDDKVGFTVEDNGGGIDDKDDKLFTPFFSSKKKGMGLGLYSCKQLIEDSNGTIDYYDAPEGAGFRVSLQPATETKNDQ